MGINELSKSQLANYLYVRDIIKSEAEIDNNISVIDMMLYLMPIILIIIIILIILLLYREKIIIRGLSPWT
jgi:hypothetical protein